VAGQFETLELWAEDRVQQSGPQTIVGDGVHEASAAEHQKDRFGPQGERVDQFDRRGERVRRVTPWVGLLGCHAAMMLDRYAKGNNPHVQFEGVEQQSCPLSPESSPERKLHHFW
jgi:hypothetical protein